MTKYADLVLRGLASAKPAAGIEGRQYFTSDTSKMYRDNGSTWDEVTVAAAGSGTPTSYFVGVVILSSTAAGGGVANFSTGTISTTDYSKIEIVLDGLSSYASAQDYINLTLNGDTTVTNYRYARHYAYQGDIGAVGGDQRYIGNFPGTTTASMTGSLTATIANPGAATLRKNIYSVGMFRYDATSIYTSTFALQWESIAAITSMLIAPASGSNFAEGTFCSIVGYKAISLMAA